MLPPGRLGAFAAGNRPPDRQSGGGLVFPLRTGCNNRELKINYKRMLVRAFNANTALIDCGNTVKKRDPATLVRFRQSLD